MRYLVIICLLLSLELNIIMGESHNKIGKTSTLSLFPDQPMDLNLDPNDVVVIKLNENCNGTTFNGLSNDTLIKLCYDDYHSEFRCIVSYKYFEIKLSHADMIFIINLGKPSSLKVYSEYLYVSTLEDLFYAFLLDLTYIFCLVVICLLLYKFYKIFEHKFLSKDLDIPIKV